ncbi:hypothetical protein K431DRAFT_100887 [Polychaeton citri CBS 116435]|uniref:Homeobox domain-containing protein n=1 Tax=Polychaeton citri CBS 116435 TaxID=1314669 RepID=A0A9P4UR83_9PEZI|nr:hypothetical protein K431DRAFT_100887 [Polychaeton citri CBS 116435]
MDGLALRDSRYARSRLLTPEASRASDASNGSQSPDDCPRRTLPSTDQLEKSIQYGAMDSRFRMRDYGREPHSPPYSRNDASKPSLPPLKSVLGSEMVSPPATPSMQDTPIQPSPQEPAFMANYKPAAFYPNKKPRTDPRMESEIHTSPAYQAATTDARGPGYRMGLNTDLPSAASDAGSRRTSLPYHSQPGRGTIYSPREQPLSKSALVTGQSSDNSAYGGGIPTLPTAIPNPHANAIQASESLQRDYYPSRRSSNAGYNTYDRYVSSIASPTMSPARHSYHPRSAAALAPTSCAEEIRRYEHLDRRANPDGYGRGEDSPFFMPNHYEYQHGKARKRSNLPKQSTEIMKTWFDQNIHNPYPSEEQKQFFSSATGISLTQVSNWFINHRRRCPELRDRRDRTRIGDRDIEV